VRNNVHEDLAGVPVQGFNNPQQFQYVDAALAPLVVRDEGLRLAEPPREVFLRDGGET
jgi:hypothetical protein